ncbi:putative DNA modification methylase [Shewanella inventionis]|uniref:DNA modification methylase n=2 Tax=Shewanella inventionis TaxID=1738770 RepID=A0ABQ1IWU5_9GAMM|nr:putative DNA modification methylase [Shewanella inventionis]
MFDVIASSELTPETSGQYKSTTFDVAFPVQTIAGLSLFKTPDAESIKKLLEHYIEDAKRIENVMELLKTSDAQFALNYLQSGPNNYVNTQLSSYESALKGLSADYWNKALALTDVLDHMPADTRLEWKSNISNWEAPLFERDTVISTVLELLLNRDKFLAEKVDLIFKGLSKSHVTNSPAGFSQRFIINGIIGSVQKKESIDDLRQIIASFMGRSTTKMRHMNTGSIIERAWQNNPGKWLELDGGAIKFKVFKKQTIHIEIHPDLAWRLNEILSVLYPQAIPEEFKSRGKGSKTIKDFDLKQHLLSNDLLYDLVQLEATRIWDRSGYEPRLTGRKNNSVTCRYHLDDKTRQLELDTFLKSCGGVRTNKFLQEWDFEYDFLAIRDDIIRLGKAPEHISHQYYPTQDMLSDEVIARLEICSTDDVLEPSAGLGAIAKKMKPSAKTVTCVEISSLHALVLAEMGFDNVINKDFIKYAETAPKFDKIAMNPPFSQGRAKLHVETAITLLKGTGSKLVAIVPPTLKNKLCADGCSIHWSNNFDKQFDKTNVTVCIVEIVKK